MRESINYNFKLPERDDYIIVEDFNGNFVSIDSLIKGIEEALAILDTAGVDIMELLRKKADLDGNNKILVSQLPDLEQYRDVVMYEVRGNFPSTGSTGKLYIDKSTNIIYRWNGSSYVEVSKALSLGETSTTAYRGDRGKIAYDHSQSAHLALGETQSTAYRGDRGKEAYDHSQATHAPVDVYTKKQVDDLIVALREELTSDIITQILAYS